MGAPVARRAARESHVQHIARTRERTGPRGPRAAGTTALPHSRAAPDHDQRRTPMTTDSTTPAPPVAERRTRAAGARTPGPAPGTARQAPPGARTAGAHAAAHGRARGRAARRRLRGDGAHAGARRPRGPPHAARHRRSRQPPPALLQRQPRRRPRLRRPPVRAPRRGHGARRWPSGRTAGWSGWRPPSGSTTRPRSRSWWPTACAAAASARCCSSTWPRSAAAPASAGSRPRCSPRTHPMLRVFLDAGFEVSPAARPRRGHRRDGHQRLRAGPACRRHPRVPVRGPLAARRCCGPPGSRSSGPAATAPASGQP